MLKFEETRTFDKFYNSQGSGYFIFNFLSFNNPITKYIYILQHCAFYFYLCLPYSLCLWIMIDMKLLILIYKCVIQKWTSRKTAAWSQFSHHIWWFARKVVSTHCFWFVRLAVTWNFEKFKNASGYTHCHDMAWIFQ